LRTRGRRGNQITRKHPPAIQEKIDRPRSAYSEIDRIGNRCINTLDGIHKLHFKGEPIRKNLHTRAQKQKEEDILQKTHNNTQNKAKKSHKHNPRPLNLIMPVLFVVVSVAFWSQKCLFSCGSIKVL
jgi:hypothetical protein